MRALPLLACLCAPAISLLAACSPPEVPDAPAPATGPHGAPASATAPPPDGPTPAASEEPALDIVDEGATSGGAPSADAPADDATSDDATSDDAPADEDRARLLEATARYDDDAGAEMTRRLRAELALLGKPAPKLAVAAWVQGRAPTLEGPDARGTVVAFFAHDHPAADSAAKALQALATREAGRGLAVVAITPATDRKAVAAWLSERGVTFPVALDRGTSTADAYRRSSPVSAVLVVRGKMVWTGNPARIDAALLDKHF